MLRQISDRCSCIIKTQDQKLDHLVEKPRENILNILLFFRPISKIRTLAITDNVIKMHLVKLFDFKACV